MVMYMYKNRPFDSTYSFSTEKSNERLQVLRKRANNKDDNDDTKPRHVNLFEKEEKAYKDSVYSKIASSTKKSTRENVDLLGATELNRRKHTTPGTVAEFCGKWDNLTTRKPSTNTEVKLKYSMDPMSQFTSVRCNTKISLISENEKKESRISEKKKRRRNERDHKKKKKKSKKSRKSRDEAAENEDKDISFESLRKKRIEREMCEKIREADVHLTNERLRGGNYHHRYSDQYNPSLSRR